MSKESAPSTGAQRAPRRKKSPAEPSLPPPPGGSQEQSRQPTVSAPRRRTQRKKEEAKLQIEFVVGGEKFLSHEEAENRLAALKELSRLDSLVDGINSRLPKRNKMTRKVIADVLRASVLAGSSVDDLAQAFRLDSGGDAPCKPDAPTLAARAAQAAATLAGSDNDEAGPGPDGFSATPPPFTPPPFAPPQVSPPPFTPPGGTA